MSQHAYVSGSELITRILSKEWVYAGVLSNAAFTLRPGETYFYSIVIGDRYIERFCLDRDSRVYYELYFLCFEAKQTGILMFGRTSF